MPRVIHGGKAWGHVRLGLGVGAAIALVVIAIHWAGWLERSELRTLDMRFVARLLWDDDTIPSGPITVVAIDERSLETIGRWPWPWREQARLVEAITQSGAGAVGLNILYAESDGDQDGVARLGLAVADNRRVVLAAATSPSQLPVPLLAEAASGVGFIDVVTDRDGVIRRIQPEATAFGDPFAVALMRAAGGAADLARAPQPFMINYRPASRGNRLSLGGLAETVSAVDVLAGTARSQLRGKIVLVGVTARGVQEMHNTPFMAQVPGVYLHAFVLRSLLLGDFVRQAPRAVTVSSIVILSLLGSGVSFLVRPWFLTIVTTVSASLVVAAGLYLFLHSGVWVEVVPLLAVLALTFVGGLAYAHQVVDRDTRRVRSLFRRYVAPEVVDRLLQDAGSVEIGRRAVVTVLFADIRQFTSFAERVTPEEAVQTLDRYLQAMAEAVLAHGGTLDKYIGDAVMAIFGAPLPRHDHAVAAIDTALDIRRRVEELGRELAHSGPELRVGIGIHSGEAVVGSIGSPRRREYTAIGDVVNVASRLEEAARPGEIVMSRETLCAWGKPAPSPPVELAIRGRQDCITLYRLSNDTAEETATEGA